MDADAEEIFRDRLRFDIDIGKVKNKQNLIDEINKLPDTKTSLTGKTIDLSNAKKNLLNNVDSLLRNSPTLQADIVSNTILDVKDGEETREELDVIEKEAERLDLSKTEKERISRAVFDRSAEILKETGSDIKKEELQEFVSILSTSKV